MRYEQPEVLVPEKRSLDERAYVRDHVRHDVAIDGFVVGRAGKVFPARVADISSSGLALDVDYGQVDTVTPALERGMRAVVRLPRTAGGAAEEWIETEVKIMWCRKNLVGAHFEHPDGLLYRTLQALVAAEVNARAAAAAEREQQVETARRHRLRSTRKILEQALPSLVSTLHSGLVNRLRLAAPTDPTAAREAAHFDEKATAITRTIEHEFMIAFALLCDLDCTQEFSIAQLRAARAEAEGAGTTARQRDEHMASLIEVVEDRCAPALRSFAARLEAVLGYNIDPLRNPLAPAALCRAIWGAFLAHARSPRIERVLTTVMAREFASAFVSVLEALAADLADAAAPKA